MNNKDYIEELSAKVHDAWWIEKKRQGFHAPMDCYSLVAKRARDQEDASDGHNEFPKFHKFCDRCHPDMYPYNKLPENIKDYDRVTVKAVLSAIESLN